MRDYAKVSPAFWTGDTGRAMRPEGPWVRVVAAYLMTAPGANMIGLFYLAIPTLAHEIGSPLEGALEALRRVCGLGFAAYDEDAELVWVPEMARCQVGLELQPKDNRHAAVVREWQQFRKHPFYIEFWKRYGSAYHLPEPTPEEAPPKPLRRPLEAPSKPGAGAGTRSEEEEKLAGSASAPPAVVPAVPASPVVATLPCVGAGSASFEVTEAQVAQWRTAYPGIDVLGEVLKAAVWLDANPTRRKTHKGMPRFLVSWLSRAQDRGGSSASQQPLVVAKPKPPARWEPQPQDLYDLDGISQNMLPREMWGRELDGIEDGKLERAGSDAERAEVKQRFAGYREHFGLPPRTEAARA